MIYIIMLYIIIYRTNSRVMRGKKNSPFLNLAFLWHMPWTFYRWRAYKTPGVEEYFIFIFWPGVRKNNKKKKKMEEKSALARSSLHRYWQGSCTDPDIHYCSAWYLPADRILAIRAITVGILSLALLISFILNFFSLRFLSVSMSE